MCTFVLSLGRKAFFRVATRKFSIAMSDDEKQGKAAMSGKFCQKLSKAMQLPCFFKVYDLFSEIRQNLAW
jgi:hypothetical protein